MTPLCHKKVPGGQLAPTSTGLLKGGQGVHPFILFLGMEAKISKEVETMTVIRFTLNYVIET